MATTGQAERVVVVVVVLWDEGVWGEAGREQIRVRARRQARKST